MSLIDTISNLPFLRRFYQPVVTTGDRPAEQRGVDLAKEFTVLHDRRSVIKDCVNMYDTDPRIEEAIGRLAEDVTRGGFWVEIKPKEGTTQRTADQAQWAITDLVERLRLVTELDDWIRETERDGDTFLEVSIDAALLIQKLTRKPVLEMHRNSDDKDEFPDPTRAFWQAGESWTGFFTDNAPPPNAIFYQRWQIVHARLKHNKGSRYGTPRFKSARQSWKLVNKGERDMGVRRAVRATMRYSHKIQNANETSIEKYVALNKPKQDDSNIATRDFFGAEVTAVQGDANLGEVGDIKWHLDTVAAASPVPFAIMFGGENLNRDILEDQVAAYEKDLISASAWVVTEFIRPIAELQLLLLGIWPGDLEMTVVWAREEAQQAKVAQASAQAAEQVAAAVAKAGEAGTKLRAAGIPDEVIDAILVEIVSQAMPGLDRVDITAKIKQARRAQEPDPIDRIDRGADVPPAPSPANGRNGNGRAAETINPLVYLLR